LFVEVASWEKNPPLAAAANEANVCTETHDLPLVAAAGVLFAKSNDVPEMNFDIHNNAL